MDGAYYVCFYQSSMYVFSTSTIIKYGPRCVMNCKDSTVAFTRYVPKEVLLVPTSKATRYNLKDG